MIMMVIARYALVSAALLLSGCETTTYQYKAPASDQGRACVTQCAGIKEMCRATESDRAQRDKESCERTSDIKLKACLHKADNKDQQTICNKERSRKSCYASDTSWRCESGYRSCFVNCGGSVIESKK